MTNVFVAAATVLALAVTSGHPAVANHHAVPMQTAEAEGGSINNNYGTPQAQPLYAAFVQPTAAITAPVSL